MSESIKLSAERRESRGSRAMRRLRAEGRIPGILYGGAEEPLPISLSKLEITTMVRQGLRGLVDLDVEGKHKRALIQDMQWDTFGIEVLHVDLTRVAKGGTVQQTVPVHLRGNAPGAASGMLVQHHHELSVECSAEQIPDEISVTINELEFGQAIRAKDLDVGESVRVLLDPEEIVVEITATAEEPEEEETGGLAEPELIRRESEEAEEG